MGISEVAACHLMVNVSKALATLTVSISVDACNGQHKLLYTWTTPVADLRGASLQGPKVSQFHAVFFGKFGKIVGWRPLLRGILDPPLNPHQASVSYPFNADADTNAYTRCGQGLRQEERLQFYYFPRIDNSHFLLR